MCSLPPLSEILKDVEKQNCIIGGSRKNNDDRRKNDEEEEFTRLLNAYAKHKSKYDQKYKTLTQEDIQNYKE